MVRKKNDNNTTPAAAIPKKVPADSSPAQKEEIKIKDISASEIIDLLKTENGIRLNEYKELTQFGNEYIAKTMELLKNTGYELSVFDDVSDNNRKHIKVKYQVEIIRPAAKNPAAVPKTIPTTSNHPILNKKGDLSDADIWKLVEDKVPYSTIRDAVISRKRPEEIRSAPNVMKIIEHIAQHKRVLIEKGEDDIIRITVPFK